MPKYSAGISGHKINIDNDWYVLDIGSGHNPHPRANVLLDKNVANNRDRSGKPIKIDKEREFIEASVESIPKDDKTFDYAIASHIAEHVEHPAMFCKEIMRIAKRGYIETPSKFAEILFDEPFHNWYVYRIKDELVFERIRIRERLGLLGELFYAAYYVNIKREGKKTFIFSNGFLRYITDRIIIYLLRKPLMLSGILYTRFEWEGSFRYRILDSATKD